ncbi:MAG: (2Fe-2S)-binding protein [Gammaproteobacteria bacterium]
MYICVCKAVTDKQIKTAIANGACSHRQLVHCLGVARNCGKCSRDVRELLDEHAANDSSIAASWIAAARNAHTSEPEQDSRRKIEEMPVFI